MTYGSRSGRAVPLRTTLLIRGAIVAGAGPVDIRIAGDRIVDVNAGLTPTPEEEVVEAGGNAVIPGLHDHHVHLRAWAAATTSVTAGPPEVRTADQLAVRLTAATEGAARDQWVRAVGYHESVAGPLDRWILDRLTRNSGCPVRVQHRSGALWILNSVGVVALGLDRDGLPPGVERDDGGRPTGRIWREDRWLAERLPRQVVDYRDLGTQAAAWGVTGFTDATPDQTADDLTDLIDASERGVIPQRLHLMAPLGVETGPASKATVGPVKVMLDDHDLPPLDELIGTVRAAHQAGRAVAMHCVTLVQSTWAVAAFEAAGAPGGAETDRIEHGAVLSPHQIDAVRRLGITVVTQPGFVSARGDQYRTEVDPADRGDLWRAASLVTAGVPLAAGSDAPFGPADPWVGVQAAIDRRTRDRHLLGPAERLPAPAALALWSGEAVHPGRRRVIAPGQPADLCILSEPVPPAPAIVTVVGGDVVYRIS